MRDCTTSIPVPKTKVLISFAVTAKMICAFVFAQAFCWFSYAVAHFIFLSTGGDGEKDLQEEESQIKQTVLEKQQDTAKLNRFLEKAGQVNSRYTLTQHIDS